MPLNIYLSVTGGGAASILIEQEVEGGSPAQLAAYDSGEFDCLTGGLFGLGPFPNTFYCDGWPGNIEITPAGPIIGSC